MSWRRFAASSFRASGSWCRDGRHGLIHFVLAGILWFFSRLDGSSLVGHRCGGLSAMRDLEICYLPAQWRHLDAAHLRASACAVIDVIRATSTIAVALGHGASGVRPVASMAEAFALKEQNPAALLAGERGGVALPGFDLGNSPREVTAERVQGREMILTTTNGTQALAACRSARAVVTASLLNLAAVAARLREIGSALDRRLRRVRGRFRRGRRHGGGRAGRGAGAGASVRVALSVGAERSRRHAARLAVPARN